MTTDLPTPSATECDPTSLAVIVIGCVRAVGDQRVAAAAARCEASHDTAITIVTTAARIDVLVAMVRSLRADQRVDSVLTP